MTQRDYDHDVYQIQAALHHDKGSRASVMVGSGFSFNAQKRYASARDFPLWKDIAESLVERLYPEDEEARCDALKNVGATSGVLRLAQEFEAAFGRTILLNHLRDMLPDREHEHGLLHRDLLNLLWADVFTTNYDTLLERAALPLRERRYEIVRCVSDLPLKRSPRIVKLHGTLPELNDCILTEEDYRTYPAKFSPFVAEVQVAMVKSHLCLVGFSGDDPNFLAWSGWVRDRLGEQTLPIYLWTFEEPTTFQTRMLEQRSVIPLPLSVITGEPGREAALREFLKRLSKPLGKPRPRWCLPRHLKNEEIADKPKFPQSPSSEDWLKAAFAWRANREYYPGWMVPHVAAIETLWRDTESWANCAAENPEELSSMDPPTCVLVLFELLWRIHRAVFPVYDGLALTTLDKALNRYSMWRKDQQDGPVRVESGDTTKEVELTELDSAALDLQLERLRHARETGKFVRFEHVLDETDTSSVSREQQVQAEHFKKHQRALVYLSTWNDRDLKKLLSEWDTSSAPLWALRRAGLMIEVDDRHDAEEILTQAFGDLRKMVDEGTPETWSIESWIIYVLQSLERNEKLFVTQVSQSQPPQTDTDDASETRSVTGDRRGAEAYRPRKLSSTSDEPPSPTDKNLPDLQETLNWLRERGCDPAEILKWLEEQNSREFTRAPTTSRTQKFDSRRWTRHIGLGTSDFNQRTVAAYRALRLIEDAGLPLRSGNVLFSAYPLAESAIQFLADRDVPEVTGAVLRMRTEKLIEKWFTRRRIATLPATEIQRLHDIAETCVHRLAEHPEALAGNMTETRQFEVATELLSRVAIRADDKILQELLRFTMALPTKLLIWKRWWLVGALTALVQRVCDGLSTSAFWEILPELLQLPVPGSPGFPAPLNHVHWIDPVELLGQREALRTPAQFDDLATQINATIKRVLQISDDSACVSERRYLILRLVTLVDKGLLDAEQHRGFAQALFASCDPVTRFPIDTGCLDSVVLLAPPVDGVDEHRLFAAKYIDTPWPTDSQELCSLLGSLARTGPVMDPRPNSRLRGIDWSNVELRKIAERCRSTIEKQTQVVLDGKNTNPMRNMLDFQIYQAKMVIKQTKIVVKQAAEVIDEVLLQREVVPGAVWEPIIDAIDGAMQDGLPVLEVYPKLAAFDSRFRRVLAEEIVSRLSGADEDRIVEGLRSLNHWANQLTDSRTPRIPDIVIAGVKGQLDAEYSNGLIHILDTVGNLFRRLPSGQSKRLLNRCESSLGLWSRHLVYKSVNRTGKSNPHFCEELPDLRASMTRLCVIAQNHNLTSDTVTNWLESVREDPMPEVRRALVEEDA